MTEKIVAQLDDDAYYVGPVIADESPLEPGVFLLPGGAIDAKPPTVPSGKRAKYVNGKFVFEDIPVPEPFSPTPEQIASAVSGLRASAYKSESDPLFFKAQRGEATIEEWAAKVAEIKVRYPDGVWPYPLPNA